MYNSGVSLQQSGDWLQVIGTFLSAIAVTPNEKIDEEERVSLALLGNIFQVVGNAIEVEGPWWTETNLANELQAIGSLAETYPILIPLSPEKTLRVEIGGNLTQSVGSGIAFVDPAEQGALIQAGNLLQSVGTTLKAIGGKYVLQEVENPEEDTEETGIELNITGHWVQFTGCLLAAIGDADTQWP